MRHTYFVMGRGRRATATCSGQGIVLAQDCTARSPVMCPRRTARPVSGSVSAALTKGVECREIALYGFVQYRDPTHRDSRLYRGSESGHIASRLPSILSL